MSEIKIKEKMTWTELKEIVEEWIRYGDDPFEDAMSEISYQLENCKDPAQAKVLKDVLDFMKMLQERCPHLQ